MNTATASTFEIPEFGRRRGHYTPEVPIVLSDGQTWHLMKPRIGLSVGSDPEVAAFGRDYEARLDDYYRSTIDPIEDVEPDAPGDEEYARARNAEARQDRQGKIIDRIAAEVDLAVAVLRAQYELSVEEAERLVRFDHGRDATPADDLRRKTLIDVATGRNPNPTLTDYLRCSLISVGAFKVGPEGITIEDAMGVFLILRKTGRAASPSEMVGWLKDRKARKEEEAALEQMLGLI